METRYYGTVIWFNAPRGFGFIAWSIEDLSQKDMFVHFSDLDMSGFKALKKGQKVSFLIGENYHKQPKAIDVKLEE